MRCTGRGSSVGRVALMCSTLMLALSACGADAPSPGGGGDGYPVDRVTFVVPYAPGGTTDPLARQFAAQMEKSLGIQIIVENAPGAAGAVGTDKILAAEPDGATFGMTTGSALLVAPKTVDGLSYTGPDDWTVLAKMSVTPYLLVVPADSPWQTFEDLVADAESSDVTVSTPGAFNPGDLVLEQLNSQAGDIFRASPFSGGGGEAMAAVLGGQVDAGVSALATASGQLEAGELRALAIFADEPLQLDYLDEEVPSITDLGFDATLNADFFVIAPPNLPQELSDQLAEASFEIVESPEFVGFVEGTGGVPAPLDSETASADLGEQEQTFEELFEFLTERDRLDR